MLTVHHLNNSRSQRVLWLLEELGVPYEIVRYQRQPDMRAPAELRAIHPLGKSPVITDNGNTIAESGAIVEYLDRDLRQRPPDPAAEDARAAALHLLAALRRRLGDAAAAAEAAVHGDAEARAGAAASRWCERCPSQVLTALVNPQLKQHMAFWEAELSKSEWFAGDEFTAADIQMSFPLEAAAARGGLEQGHPKAMAFLDRIHAPPGLSARAGEGRAVHGGAVTSLSFRGDAEHRTRNLEIPGLVLTHHPGMD